MKQIICEMCNSTDVIKQDGVFVCQNCGTKYSVEEAKKMMGDIPGDTPVNVQGTVKVDNSDELRNLYQIARRAKDDNNGESAAKYYDMIQIKDPTSWEAAFYVVYFKAMECKIANIQSAATSVDNCIDTVLNLIKEFVSDPAEQKEAYREVATSVMVISTMLFNGAKNHYDGISLQIKHNYTQEYLNRAFAAFRTCYHLGNHLEALFGDDVEATNLAAVAWTRGIELHASVISLLQDKEGNKNEINSYATKIQKYDPSYVAPTINTTTTSGGCYVATAVYGSYDCPEVWTLRRYRDHTLAKTWYGRAFIRTYYAISPTLVKWFGRTDWFKNMWRGTLDRMVNDLQNDGVESTPYEDKNW